MGFPKESDVIRFPLRKSTQPAPWTAGREVRAGRPEGCRCSPHSKNRPARSREEVRRSERLQWPQETGSSKALVSVWNN